MADIIQFELSYMSGIDVKTLSDNCKDSSRKNERKYASQVFDQTFGIQFDDEQKRLMAENGLDEFDLIFINGKSAREHYGFDTLSVNPAYSDNNISEQRDKQKENLKSLIVGAMADGDKSIDFCTLDKKDEGFSTTTHTVNTDIRLHERRTKPTTFMDKVKNFFGINRYKTNADKAKETFKNDTPEKRYKRHKEIEKITQERSGFVKSAKEIQKPLKESRENFRSTLHHNIDMYNNYLTVKDKNGNETPVSEKQIYDIFKDAELEPRIVSRNMLFDAYMLSRGLDMEMICSKDEQYDTAKQVLAQDFFNMVVDYKAARDKALKAEADVKAKSSVTFDNDPKRAGEREEFGKKNMINQMANGLSKEQIDKLFEEERSSKREAFCMEASKGVFDEHMKKSPAVKRFGETFLDMGREICNQKVPTNKLTDINELAKNYMKFHVLADFGLNYHSTSKGPAISFDESQKKEWDKMNGIIQPMTATMQVPKNWLDYMSSEGVYDKMRSSNNSMALGYVGKELLPVYEKELQGCNKFSDIKCDTPLKFSMMRDVCHFNATEAIEENFEKADKGLFKHFKAQSFEPDKPKESMSVEGSKLIPSNEVKLVNNAQAPAKSGSPEKTVSDGGVIRQKR